MEYEYAVMYWNAELAKWSARYKFVEEKLTANPESPVIQIAMQRIQTEIDFIGDSQEKICETLRERRIVWQYDSEKIMHEFNSIFNRNYSELSKQSQSESDCMFDFSDIEDDDVNTKVNGFDEPSTSNCSNEDCEAAFNHNALKIDADAVDFELQMALERSLNDRANGLNDSTDETTPGRSSTLSPVSHTSCSSGTSTPNDLEKQKREFLLNLGLRCVTDPVDTTRKSTRRRYVKRRQDFLYSPEEEKAALKENTDSQKIMKRRSLTNGAAKNSSDSENSSNGDKSKKQKSPRALKLCMVCKKVCTCSCENCGQSFHMKCHTADIKSRNWCPDCVVTVERKHVTETVNHSLPTTGGAISDSEFSKPPVGIYKNNESQIREYFVAETLGIRNLPSSTLVIPIDGNLPESTKVATAVGRDVTVTTVVKPFPESFSVSNQAIVRPCARRRSCQRPPTRAPRAPSATAPRAPSATAPSTTAAPATTTTTPRKLFNQLPRPVFERSQGSPFQVVSRQPRWPRRWSSDRPTITPEVSILDWSESRATTRPVEPSNYHEVTVEVIGSNDRNPIDDDNEDDDNYEHEDVVNDIDGEDVDDDNRSEDFAADNSEDCVYIGENYSGGSRHGDVDRHTEPEVLNISSGSSEVQSCSSPVHYSSTPESRENLDVSIEAVEATTSRGGRQVDGCDNSHKDFLRSIFPGRYGFKIDIYDDDYELSTSCSYDSSLDRRNYDDCGDELDESEERREYVKLEEAHLPAPPESDLIVPGETDDLSKRRGLEDDDNGSSSGSSVQELDSVVVPGTNKSEGSVTNDLVKCDESEDCDGEC